MEKKTMRLTPVVSVLSLLVLAGCDSGSKTSNISTDTSDQQTQPTGTTQEGDNGTEQVAQYSGATFVSTDPSQPGIVSFTNDTATWENGDIVETASYSNTGDQPLVATFPDRDVAFDSDGSNLTWDSVSYLRAGGSSQFDSQESMVQYFDGYSYDTVEEFDIGAGPTGEQVMGNWSMQFTGNEVSWRVQDTISIGTYTYIDGVRFKVSFGDRDITVVLLNNDRFMINSIVYTRDVSNQFDSQEKLVAFLDGATYESAVLQVVGTPTPDIGALGYWTISFSNDSFTWSHLDVAEAGTVNYLDINSFSAILPDRELTITVDGNSIFWDETRYARK